MANYSFGQTPSAHFIYDVKTSIDHFHYDHVSYIDTNQTNTIDTVYKVIYVDSAEYAQGHSFVVFKIIQPTSPNPLISVSGMTSSYMYFNNHLLDTLNLYQDTLYLTPNNIHLTDILVFDMHQDFVVPTTQLVNFTYYNMLYLTIRDTSLNGGILGIEKNITNQHEVNIYPNPASNIVTLSCFTDNSNPICIFDMMGNMVKQIVDTQDGQNEIKINISDWSKGIYIVKTPFDTKRFTVE